MKSHHSNTEFRLELDSNKFQKKLSPRVDNPRKTNANSPALRSSLVPTVKKLAKDIKKIPETSLYNRNLPSRSQKVLFGAANKLSCKFDQATTNLFQRKVVFHRSHQTPMPSERSSMPNLAKVGKKESDKGFSALKRQMCNVIKVKSPQNVNMEATNTTAMKSSWDSCESSQLCKEGFTFMDVVGRGGYGKVWKVSHRKTKKLYAMKEMSKAVIVMKKSVKSILTQRKILSRLKSPFVANMVAAFHDRQNLYLVIDLLSGGDLRSHICNRRKFSEQQARFFVACIVLGLEYLASKKVIHRDIKPENLCLDSVGYLRITDFGIACTADQSVQKDTSGTPGYMAPEVMCCQEQSYGVDHFALGVIAYELMMGKRPYRGKNRAEIRDIILSKQAQVSKHQIPSDWSVQSADFVNKLIQRHPKNRLGSKNGISDIKDHPWLRKYAWKKLSSKQLKSPYIPVAIPPQSDEEEIDPTILMQYKLLERLENYSNLFDGYQHKWTDGPL